MKLSGLVSDVLAQSLASDPEVVGISANSAAIKPGMVFAGLPGTRVDGASFAQDAVARGAIAVLVGADSHVVDLGVPVIRAENPRRELALMASRFYPRQPAHIGAVTGTAGKTSVASFLRQIWAASGCEAAMIGTTGIEAPGRKS